MKYRSLIGIALALISWYVIAQTKLVNPLFIASPENVFFPLINLFYQGNIVNDIIATLYRTGSGFIISAAIGIPIGVIMGYSRTAYDLFEPLVDFLRSTPAPALFPLFLLLFGIGDLSKLAVAVFASGLIIIINSMYGVHHTSKSRTLYTQSLGANRALILRKVVFFEALPHTFVGMRQALSISLVLIIVTEMFIGTEVGLGQRIFNSHLTYRIPEMYAAIILTGIIGYLLNVGLVRFERRVIHWAGKI